MHEKRVGQVKPTPKPVVVFLGNMFGWKDGPGSIGFRNLVDYLGGHSKKGKGKSQQPAITGASELYGRQLLALRKEALNWIGDRIKSGGKPDYESVLNGVSMLAHDNAFRFRMTVMGQDNRQEMAIVSEEVMVRDAATHIGIPHGVVARFYGATARA